jgi:acylphosphatase
MPAARFIVSGLVQGVCYRAYSRTQALQLDVTGHAINRPDGSVEVLACGPRGALDAMHHALRQGPPAARVDAVSREDLPEQQAHGFQIG